MDTLAWEQELNNWEEKYRPIKNRLSGEELFPDDKFETYGGDLDFVRAQDPRCIWTLVDGDDGNLYIVDGYHLVNRINYFVTEVPFEGEFLEVPYYIYDESEE
jgi:hypothetical protein